MARIFMSGNGAGASASLLGDGSDGPLHVTANTNLPVTADTGHIFLQLESLTVDAGATLKPADRCAGMVIVVRGDCTINGTVGMDLMAPRRSDESENLILTSGVSSKWLKLIPTLIGGKGGAGGTSGGAGGLGGNGHRFGGGYGGGGGTNYYASHDLGTVYLKGGDSEPRPPATITWPYPAAYGKAGEYGAGAGTGRTEANGGSAPGGGAGYVDSNTDYYSGGFPGQAYGGGLLLLVVGGIFKIGASGLITAKGGAGGRGGSYNGRGSAGSGGGGGGGIIALLSASPLQLFGSMTVAAGISTPPLYGTHTGNDGSIGTIHTAKLNGDGTVTPW